MKIPAILTKKISFQRMPYRHVESYEIYVRYQDPTYDSGFRTELLESIENTSEPNIFIKRIPLKYNTNATWKLPRNAYLDHDHKFRLFFNDILLPNLYYSYNRLFKLITLDTVAKKYSMEDKLELEYYQDLICKEYLMPEDGEFIIKPIFRNTYLYGNHNVII